MPLRFGLNAPEAPRTAHLGCCERWDRKLLEREAELIELAQLLDNAPSAGGRVVLIRGEAGIGKSTLINRFLALSGDRADTLLGACDDLLTPQPLAPIWDVARTTPSLRQPLADGDRRAVMETLLALLSRRQQPTLLVLEDSSGPTRRRSI